MLPSFFGQKRNSPQSKLKRTNGIELENNTAFAEKVTERT